MPKIKTNRAAAKRFKVTGTGKLKRNKAYKSHILTKKSTKRKRNLRQALITDCFATLYCLERAPLYPFANFNVLLCFFLAFIPPLILAIS